MEGVGLFVGPRVERFVRCSQILFDPVTVTRASEGPVSLTQDGP